MAGDSFYEAYVEVIPTAKGFERSLSKQLGGPSAAVGGAAGGAAGGGFVAGFGRAIPLIGGVLAAAGLGNIIGDAISNASDYAQASSAVEDVFGQLGAEAIQAFAKGGAESVGQSTNDILAASTNFGIFGQAAGLAGGDVVNFSTDLITLAADLAAFKNTSPEEAIEALGAGLRGESEPLTKYGIFLNDAALKAKALEMGIYDGNGSLTAQQRILAASGAIFEQTAIQQGQFSDESDTLAGRQATLAASLENVSTKLGEAFLPIAEQVVGFMLERGVPALEAFAAWFTSTETQEGMRVFGEALGNIGNFMQTTSDKLVIGQEQIGTFFAAVSESFSLGMTQIGDFFNGVFGWFQTMSDKLVEGQDQFFGFFAAIGEKFALGGQQIGEFAGVVGEKISEAVAFVAELPGRAATALGDLGSRLYSAGSDLIAGFIDGITSMVGDIQGAIEDAVGGAIEFAKDLLGIASPSKVFMEIGAFTGQGFAAGIESEYGRVRAATVGMTAAAIPDMSNANISGTLSIGGDGLGRIIDGRISYAASDSRRQLEAGMRY